MIFSLLFFGVVFGRFFPEHTSFKHPRNGWKVVGPASKQASIELTIALQTRNQQQLDTAFWAVSDPESDVYGEHWSMERIAKVFGQTDGNIEKVVAWVEGSGAKVVKVMDSKDYVIIEAPVKSAESMLSTQFVELSHSEKNQPLIRALGAYSVPEELKDIVSLVSGVHTMPKVSSNVDFVAAASNKLIGPVDLKQRYNVTWVGTQAKNTQAVAEFQSQNYSPSDLKTFFNKFLPHVEKTTVAGVRPAGSNNPDAPGVEASLDIQYIMGVANNVTTYFYADPSFDFWSGLTKWAALISGEPNTPLVHSISYGDQGAESKPTKAYQDNMDNTFKKLGMRGISIIFASGDSGAGCSFCIYLSPSYPATSVYVTSVGATRFINGQDGPEMAVESFGSGGGFSYDFPRPSYQDDAVKSFFKNSAGNLPFHFEYNANGRATPDVSALGIGFAVYVSGVENEVGGTSAAAPTFAAIISLLNDKKLEAGKGSLGFLNNWIYQTAAKDPQAFFDVTEGTNDDGCCFTGFTAVPGYDAVTGVGTPNAKQLLKHI